MRKYAYLAGAVIFILCLYFLGMFSHPTEISISDVEKYEGKMVVVQGMVVAKECSEKSEVLTIKDGNYSTKVFIYGSTGAFYGDRVEVSGKVERYDGQIEISADYVKISEKWDGEGMPLWDLSENFMEYAGTNVNVTGYINGIHGDYFYLTDFDRKYKIKVFYPEKTSLNVENYEHVYVKAMFKYDPEKLCMYMEIKEEEHGVTKID